MNRKLISAVIAGSLVCGAGGWAFLSSTTTAAPVPVEKLATKAEEVREAITHLKKAEALLSKADHDEKGLDYQALQTTQKAIEQCEDFLKHREGH